MPRCTHSLFHSYLYLIISQLVAELARRDEIELLKSNKSNDMQYETFDGFDSDALGFEFECEDVPDHGKNDVHGMVYC